MDRRAPSTPSKERFRNEQVDTRPPSRSSISAIGPPTRRSRGAQFDRLNQHLSRRIIESGEAMLTTTVLRGKVVLRMCLINPRTSLKDHFIRTIEMLELYAEEAARETSR